MSIYSPCPGTLFRTEWLQLSTQFCPPCSTLSSTVWETKTWRGAWRSWLAGGNPSQKLFGHVHGCLCWFLIHTTNSCKSAGVIHVCHRCLIVLTSLHVQLSTTETLLWLVIGSRSTKILIPVFIYLHLLIERLHMPWAMCDAGTHASAGENSIWGQRWDLITRSFCVINFY